MITCPECGKELADGARFCKFCGSQVLQTNMQNNTQRPVQNIQVTTPAPKKKKSTKIVLIAIISIILVVAIVLGIIFIPDLIGKKKDEDLTDKEKLTQLLEESTTKPIVEFVYDDYDSDGTYEAYAVVGETDEEDEKHPEFYDADIYFVNLKKAQPIKENISGKSNGKINLDEITYISIEVYEDGTDEGKSFIYTVDGTKSAEADISGEYSNVHEENGKVIGFDENGNEVEVDLAVNDTNEEKIEATNIVEPTEDDWVVLGDLITYTQFSTFYRGYSISEDFFDVDSSDAPNRAYNFISGFCGISQIYSFIFDFNTIDEFVADANYQKTPDPLGKFDDLPVYYRYSAEEIDWIIKNVFNVEPDRTIYSDEFLYYYYDEFFYIGGGYTGDMGYDFEVENIKDLGDGKYEVDLLGYTDDQYMEYYGDKSDYKIVATVSLKEVDGKRFWSVYKFDHQSVNNNY